MRERVGVYGGTRGEAIANARKVARERGIAGRVVSCDLVPDASGGNYWVVEFEG